MDLVRGKEDAALARMLDLELIDVREQDDDGWTLLHLAAVRGDIGIIQMLIQHGGDPRARDRLGGIAPMHLNLPAWRELPTGEVVVTEEEEHPLLQYSEDNLALLVYRAHQNRSPEWQLAALVTRSCPPQEDIDRLWQVPDDCSDCDEQLLRLAVRYGYCSVVRCLLEMGADPTVAVGDERQCALHEAAIFGQESALRVMIRHARHGAVDSLDTCCRTPLMLACCKGGGGVARCLIRQGAGVHAADDLQQTPLHHASQSGHPLLVRILCASGVDVNAIDAGGCTALLVAADTQDPNPAVCRLLLQAGVDASLRDERGWTAADAATSRGRHRIAGALRLANEAGREEAIAELQRIEQAV